MTATEDAILIRIAAAVAETLNGRDWSQPFVAERSYMARLDLDQADTLRVDVVPGTALSELSNRSQTREEYRVDIAVRKKFSVEDNAALDALAGLTQEIADGFRFTALDDPRATWVRSDIDPLFVPQHLQSWRQYTGVVRLTYRLLR